MSRWQDLDQEGKEDETMIPRDPIMLLSWANMKLRDSYPSLEELAAGESADCDSICDTLKKAGYTYDPTQNRFVISN